VVVDERKPVGIITTGDLMLFFRDRSALDSGKYGSSGLS
jgi:CBS domain-containing protein